MTNSNKRLIKTHKVHILIENIVAIICKKTYTSICFVT